MPRFGAASIKIRRVPHGSPCPFSRRRRGRQRRARAIVGRLVGAIAGSVIDRALFGARNFSVDGPRLADLTVMSAPRSG